MSEYQYYEFVAVDKPLNEKQMAELRARSTRATITTSSFVNDYQWGDLKGDPQDWMRRYFDAHVYIANWGNYTLSLRVPRDLFDIDMLNDFETASTLSFEPTETHWIVTWTMGEDDEGDYFESEGQGWMGRLLPLRDELMRGDWRSLYLGWLAGAASGDIDEDEAIEPPPPPGLSRLSAAQEALAEFLAIDDDWLLAAAVGDTPNAAAQDDENEFELWFDSLSPAESRALLKRVARGESHSVERELKMRYGRWRRDRTPQPKQRTRRSVDELRQLAQTCEQRRRQGAAEQHAKALAAQQAKREIYLRSMATDFARSWRMADNHAISGIASGYDAATKLIVDLAAAYDLCASRAEFDHAMREFMANHGRRSALTKRLIAAGVWRKP